MFLENEQDPGVIYIFKTKICLAASTLCLLAMLFFPQPALTEHRILINKGTNQLAFFEDNLLLDVFPVATGRLLHYTPEGDWQVVNKLVYPAWRHPDGGPLIPGGVPENPLGPRWLGLNALGTAGSSYGVHGNNNPYSIGTYASSGCIRMHNEDILWLYERVAVGTKVQITSTGQDLLSLKKYDRVSVNGVEQDLARHLGPVQAGATTYLPLRPLAQALGCQLTWEGSSNTLLAANIDREVQLAIGSKKATVNQATYETADAPLLLENMTYIPDYYLKIFFGADFLGEENRMLKINAPVAQTERGLVKYHLQLSVNGKMIDLPESLTPLYDGENLLVPLRPFCAAAGAEAGWNKDAQSVEIKTAGRLLSIPLDGSPARLDHDVLAQQAHIFVHAGTSFIDLDFLQDLLGFKAEVDYDVRTLKISITKKARIAALVLPPVQMSFRIV
ncbi:MAG: stalk domain-containing protein [Desulfotomaculaceae bacterium]|nr:stalk domain-containing protein [Desulfotomaculaceae bacterium]MDD4767382.1 stalk domain-containing protein [Desulfotomaculaceae bacterium]